MFKCNHCNITFKKKDDEGILTFRGKMYCKRCEEPIIEIPDSYMPQAVAAIHGAQATLISNSDNRITTNNYYGNGTPDEQIDTAYGQCRKSEACFCKQCRQWVPITFFNTEKDMCDNCVEHEGTKAFGEGKKYYEVGLYDEALNEFLKYEPICNPQSLSDLQGLIGRCYYEQGEYKKAVKYFVIASQNNTESMFYFGLCYYNGYGVPQSKKKAIEIIQKAKNLGNQEATNFLLEAIERIDMRLITEDDRYGFTDEEGNIVIPCKWKWVTHNFREGLALVTDDNGKMGFIDKTGNLVVPCKWQQDTHDFHEGLALVKDSNGKCGFIDKKGNLVAPCIWSAANDFCEGLALVKDDNGKKGYIDKNGFLAIPCKWQNAFDFHNGKAYVKGEDGIWVYINKKGEIIQNIFPY